MTTPRKKWPQHAEYARMDTIAAANRLRRKCDEIIFSDDLPHITAMQIAAEIKDGLVDIERWMIQARPEKSK